jgi:hypothetical protein
VVARAPAHREGAAVKLVINKCFGGFGLSDAAYERLIELGIPTCPFDNREHGLAIADTSHPESINDGALSAARFAALSGGRYNASWLRESKHRGHPLLVKVVEELGPRASGRFGKLAVVEIPDGVDWEIDEYDGLETIHEAHRSWG